MMRNRQVWGAWVLVIASLAAACSGGAEGSAAGVAQTPAASDPDHDAHEHHDDHDHHVHENDDRDDGASGEPPAHGEDAGSEPNGAGPEGGRDGGPPAPARTTEDTLAAIAAMDPDRLAGAHDHGDHAHGDHAHREHSDPGPDAASPHLPNGIDPHRIVIPSIGVDADVIDLGLQPDGTMEVPTDFAQTGWFTPGPRPGRVGPAVIAGHVDSRDGPAVFVDLADLEVGAHIEVHDDDGQVATFAVREQEQVAKDEFPTDRVYGGTPGSELRLITCGGIFDRSIGHYDDNIIVYAERIDT
jgi:hypothetical protein